jgi:hypothetical protein
MPSIITFLNMLKKCGVKLSELMATVVEGNNDLADLSDDEIGERQKEFGIQMFGQLLDGLTNAEEYAYKFISQIFNMKIEDSNQLDIFEEILPALKEYEGWKAFIKSAVSLEKTLKKS